MNRRLPVAVVLAFVVLNLAALVAFGFTEWKLIDATAKAPAPEFTANHDVVGDTLISVGATWWLALPQIAAIVVFLGAAYALVRVGEWMDHRFPLLRGEERP